MARARLLSAISAVGWMCAAPGHARPAEPAPPQAPGPAAPRSPFVYPAELEQDVRFWIRVYTEVGSDQGLLHDDRNLGLVYEVLRFDADLSPGLRERRVSEAKSRYGELLRRFAAGTTDGLTAHERRIFHAFGDKPAPAQFKDAIAHIRFQLGQADRFHAGLERAAAWETHIARTLRDLGVPEEIAALPHVESSFNTAAYSRVGAAGLWQFMPSTARRFMRVDSVVDQRLDPYSATEAAANLMLYNYRLLGTWPLTVTAYNHGPGGLRRAQDELGTSDIAVIVRRYQGSSFGFASRNFYVAFLAALEVDRHAARYFGPIASLPNTDSWTTELPDYVPIDALARAFKADLGALRVLNPALRPPVWNGTRFVPRGYALRLPGAPPAAAERAAAWARLPLDQRYLAQRNDGTHRMRKGETLALVALRNGVPLSRLLAVNPPRGATAQGGQVVAMPLPATRAEQAAPAAATAPNAASAAASIAANVAAALPGTAWREGPRYEVPPIEASLPARGAREPVVDWDSGSALAPAAAPATGTSDTTDYGVAADGTVVVQAAETLGHLADWSGVSASRLRNLNNLHQGLVGLGRKVRLDLSHVTTADFEAARRDYHRQLQETFFASHRIAGTENYAVKRGESLWTIAKQHADLPIWLVAQYNPDVDFNDVRPGTPIALPRVVAINRR